MRRGRPPVNPAVRAPHKHGRVYGSLWMDAAYPATILSMLPSGLATKFMIPAAGLQVGTMRRWIRRQFSQHALILLYHRIDHSRCDPWQLSVTPEHFEQHLEVLR